MAGRDLPPDDELDERARDVLERLARGEHVEDAEALEALGPLPTAGLSETDRERLRSMSEPEFMRRCVQALVVQQARDTGRGGLDEPRRQG